MFECDKCGKPIGDEENPIYQVRKGYAVDVQPYKHMEPDRVDFEPYEDVGYYCSDCLLKGV